MQIKSGWSGELSSGRWAKVDIDLDETDVRRLLVEHDIDIEPDRIPSRYIYTLLTCEAEFLMQVTLSTRHGQASDTERLTKLRAELRTVVDRIKELAGQDNPQPTPQP